MPAVRAEYVVDRRGGPLITRCAATLLRRSSGRTLAYIVVLVGGR